MQPDNTFEFRTQFETSRGGTLVAALLFCLQRPRRSVQTDQRPRIHAVNADKHKNWFYSHRYCLEILIRVIRENPRPGFLFGSTRLLMPTDPHYATSKLANEKL